ncbi:MAG TPA: hypothetical protein VJP78_03265 [Thermoleophilia bacterium]|nr:hypothetical protein [Thermoleophilia bacterium]
MSRIILGLPIASAGHFWLFLAREYVLGAVAVVSCMAAMLAIVAVCYKSRRLVASVLLAIDSVFVNLTLAPTFLFLLHAFMFVDERPSMDLGMDLGMGVIVFTALYMACRVILYSADTLATQAGGRR